MKNILILTSQLLKEFIIVWHRISGGRLFEHLFYSKAVQESTLIAISTQILESLQYLHERDIVHLDLKVKRLDIKKYTLTDYPLMNFFLSCLQPENILVDTLVAEGIPKIVIVDFGDAVRAVRGSDYTHKVLGSPEFVAPEIIRMHPVSTAADIWSLGVILYTM